MLSWFFALFSVAAGCGIFVSLLQFLNIGRRATLAEIWDATLFGAVFCGVYAFMKCYGTAYGEMINRANGEESENPHRSAWSVAMSAAVVLSSVLVADAGHQPGKLWESVLVFFVAVAGGLSGLWVWKRVDSSLGGD